MVEGRGGWSMLIVFFFVLSHALPVTPKWCIMFWDVRALLLFPDTFWRWKNFKSTSWELLKVLANSGIGNGQLFLCDITYYWYTQSHKAPWTLTHWEKVVFYHRNVAPITLPEFANTNNSLNTTVPSYVVYCIVWSYVVYCIVWSYVVYCIVWSYVVYCIVWIF